jgi:adenylate cyclase, class 2
MSLALYNLERKARCGDLCELREQAVKHGARFLAEETQADTYFHVPHGRLKLREINGLSATLIAYDRPDQKGSRLSSYHLVPVVHTPGLMAALAAALGVRGVVQKRRTIYLWHNVRIHLDEVEGLGTFVEFEAVLGPDDDEATAEERLEELGGALAIDASAYLATSYADLLGM